MKNEFWLNVASKDLKKSKDFYTKLGFVMNNTYENPEMLSMFVGTGKTILNLFSEKAMQEFSQNSIVDPKKFTEILFSLGASSRAEVDAMAKSVAEAGGTVFAQPGEKDDWMYGCGFADPDGHRWSILFMDMSKMSKR